MVRRFFASKNWKKAISKAKSKFGYESSQKSINVWPCPFESRRIFLENAFECNLKSGNVCLKVAQNLTKRQKCGDIWQFSYPKFLIFFFLIKREWVPWVTRKTKLFFVVVVFADMGRPKCSPPLRGGRGGGCRRGVFEGIERSVRIFCPCLIPIGPSPPPPARALPIFFWQDFAVCRSFLLHYWFEWEVIPLKSFAMPHMERKYPKVFGKDKFGFQCPDSPDPSGLEDWYQLRGRTPLVQTHARFIN